MNSRTKKKSKPFGFLKGMLVFLFITAIIWCAIWFGAKYFVHKNFDQVSVSKNGTDETIKVSGFPFTFKIALKDYAVDIEDYVGEPAIIKGESTNITWKIVQPLQLKAALIGAHRYEDNVSDLRFNAKSGQNYTIARIALNNQGFIDLHFDDAEFSKADGRVSQEPIAMKGFAANFVQDVKSGNMKFDAAWASLTMPMLSQDVQFLGRVIENGRVSGVITKLLQALERGGALLCDVNTVGGRVDVTDITLDWGAFKPRLSAFLDSDSDGFTGVIKVKLQDTEAFFDAIAPLVPRESSLVFSGVKLAMISAEENNAPFPMQIQNGQLRILSQGVLDLVQCPAIN